MNVLEALRHPALRGEVAGDHLAAFGVHHLRIGRGAARHVEERRKIEPHAFGKRQSFSKRQAVETQDEVDGELGARAVADVADVESSRQQHVEDGCERGIGRRASTDQPDALTAQHLIASTRDRRLDEGGCR